jgi:hypothetical protein
MNGMYSFSLFLLSLLLLLFFVPPRITISFRYLFVPLLMNDYHLPQIVVPKVYP